MEEPHERRSQVAVRPHVDPLDAGAREDLAQRAPPRVRGLAPPTALGRAASVDVADLAAWTLVASAVLNLDETLTKE